MTLFECLRQRTGSGQGERNLGTVTVMENMMFFLAELGLMQYPTIILYCPSMMAASAVYAARCTLDRTPFWTETLSHHTGYSEDQLPDFAKLLVKFHASAAESKLEAVYRKFLSPDHGAVSLLTPAKTLAFYMKN